MMSPSCVGGHSALLYHTRLRKYKAKKPRSYRDRMVMPHTAEYLAAKAILTERAQA